MNDHDSNRFELGRPERVAPGLWVERRSFLGLAAACLTGAASGRGRDPASELPADAHLDFEEFLTEVVPIARTLVADTSRVGEDRYLLTLASYAVRLADVPVPELEQKSVGERPKTFLGFNPGGDPFNVLHWKLDPHATIAVHAHAFGNVVTVGLAGAARIQNFEMVGERDFAAQGKFTVRKCKEQILLPHDVNTVALAHGYCHGFLAGPEGARGLDLTTRLLPKRSVPLLDIAAQPFDAEQQLYEATWRFDEK